MQYQSGNTLWMLVGVLTLPISEQERVIGGINSNKDECSNHLVQFLSALQVFQDSFYDHFDFELNGEFEIYEKFKQLLRCNHFKMDIDGFYNDESWNNLRKSGTELLKVTGLPVYEPIDIINFEDFLEFVYDDNGNLVALN